MRKLKRNDIVAVPSIRRNEEGEITSIDRSHMFYGRVNKRIDDKHVEVIYCGSNWGVFEEEHLDYTPDYQGYWSNQMWYEEGKTSRFIRMPTLRRLKQAAARYDHRVWKRFRNDKPRWEK